MRMKDIGLPRQQAETGQQVILKNFSEHLQTIGEEADYETVIEMGVLLANLMTYKAGIHKQLRSRYEQTARSSR